MWQRVLLAVIAGSTAALVWRLTQQAEDDQALLERELAGQLKALRAQLFRTSRD